MRKERWTKRHRGVVVAAVVVGMLALATAGVWLLVVPSFRPGLASGEQYGVDVSHHQGAIDWEAVAGDDIAFAYIKSTEGGDHLDTRFEENWLAADRAGLARGAYHFFTLCRSGREQAQWFLAVVPPEPDALTPAVDLELGGNCAFRPAQGDLDAELDTFLAIVEQAWGRPALLYVGDDWESVYPVREDSDRPLWLRRLFLRPDSDRWQVWQFSAWARVDGIQGGVDLNVGRLR